MMKHKFIFDFLILLFLGVMANDSKPKCASLFIIDGLHWQAPNRLEMPVFNRFITGKYSRFNSSSFFNPVMWEGMLFLSNESKMIQEYFPAQEKTAFVVTQYTACRSIGCGFSTLIMDGTLLDHQGVEKAREILEQDDHAYMRIHLQTPSIKGYKFAQATIDKPYFRYVFSAQSPCAKTIEEADKVLGTLVVYLKKSGKREDTFLIVTSDHRQSLGGWHPLFDEDSWLTPALFLGSGIAKVRALDYFEHTDVVHTIEALM